MKRNGGIFAFLSIIFSSLVSAQAGPVEGLERLTYGARDMIIILTQFISDVLFDLDSFDEFFFAKILLFLLVFLIIYTVLRRNDIFGRDKKITVIITAAISILSIRYLPVEFVEVILLQYSALAVGLTTILPLMIFFFFLHQSGFGHKGRQIGWLIYGAALLAITGMRYEDLGNASYIYYAAIIGVVASILLDRTIHAQFLHKEGKATEKQRNFMRASDLRRSIKRLEDDIADLKEGTSDMKYARKMLADMKKRLERLRKESD